MRGFSLFLVVIGVLLTTSIPGAVTDAEALLEAFTTASERVNAFVDANGRPPTEWEFDRMIPRSPERVYGADDVELVPWNSAQFFEAAEAVGRPPDETGVILMLWRGDSPEYYAAWDGENTLGLTFESQLRGYAGDLMIGIFGVLLWGIAGKLHRPPVARDAGECADRPPPHAASTSEKTTRAFQLLPSAILGPPLVSAGAGVALVGGCALMGATVPFPGHRSGELSEVLYGASVLFGLCFLANLLDAFGDGLPRVQRRMGTVLACFVGFVLVFMYGLAMSFGTVWATLLGAIVIMPLATIVITMRALRLALLRRAGPGPEESTPGRSR